MKTFRFYVSLPVSLVGMAFFVIGLALELLSDLISGSQDGDETNWQEHARPHDYFHVDAPR